MRPRSFAAFAAALLFCAQPRTASAQHVDPRLWLVDGTVRAMARIGETLYLGGSFNSIGPDVGGGVPVGATSAQRTAGFPIANGAVRCAAPDGAGGWFLGGDFDSLGDLPRAHVGHVLPDLTVDPAWNPGANGIVYALLVDGGTVTLGGAFTQVAGQARAGLAAVDATTGALLGWNPNVTGTVRALLRGGSFLYVGGNFTTVGGVTRRHLAQIDASTGVPTSWNPNPTGGTPEVWSLAIQNSILYVGGNYTGIGGQSRTGLSAIDLATMTVTSWSPGTRAYAMALTPTTMFICGTFAGAGANLDPRNGIAEISLSTGIATAWNPGANNGSATYALARVGSTLYAGGSFTSVGGQTRLRAVAIDATTGSVLPWAPDAGGNVRCMVADGATVFIGGEFQTVNPVRRASLAALDLTTGEATGWNPSPDGAVNALAVDGTTLYVGGGFTQLAGTARARIGAFDTGTGALTSWDPGSQGPNLYAVNAIDPAGSLVYVGGTFTALGGQSRNGLAAVDATTGLATGWNPAPGGLAYGVNAIARDQGLIYVAGSFSTIGGQSRKLLAALDPATGIPTSWNPSLSYVAGFPDPFPQVMSLLPSGPVVYVGGDFHLVGGVWSAWVAAIDATSGTLASWAPNANESVRALLLAGSTLQVGGDFTSVADPNSAPRPHAAAWDLDTQHLEGSQFDPNGDVYCYSVSGSTLYAGGAFTRISGVHASGIAAIVGGVTVGVPSGVEPAQRIAVLPSLPNPAHGAALLRFATVEPGRVSLEVLDLSGRRVRTLLEEAEMPAGRHEMEFRRGSLRSGLYFVRVRSGASSATGKLIVTP